MRAFFLVTVACSLCFAGGERLKDHEKLRDNIEKAKGLTAAATGQAGAFSEDERNCICEMLGEDSSTPGAEGTPKLEAGTCIPDTTAGRVEATKTESATETKRKPTRMLINNKIFGQKKMKCEFPAGSINYNLWQLAEVLAHEKDHWTNPNDKWKPQPGAAGVAAAVGGDRESKSHTEHRAYCRSLKMMEAAKAYYDKQVADGKMKAHSRDTLFEVCLNDRIIFIKKKKNKYKPGTKESKIILCEKNDKKAKDAMKCDDPQPPPPPPSPPGPGGPTSGNGDNSIGTEEDGYDRDVGIEYWMDGFDAGQPFWLGITPKQSGSYDDSSMIAVTFDYAQVDGPTDYVRGHYGFWPLDLDGATHVRLTLYTWANGVTVDWNALDLAAATRLDLDDIELIDNRVNTNTAGDTIGVDSRYMAEGQEFRVYFEGPAQSTIELIAYRLDDNGDLPQSGDPLGALSTDANGEGALDVTVPTPAGSASRHVALKAEYGGDEIGIMLVLKPDSPDDGDRVGALVAKDDIGREFHVHLDSIREPIDSGTAAVGFRLHNFDASWQVRIFATPKQGGAYDDQDAVQLTTQAEAIGGSGHLFIDIPCLYQDGQAYRLTACAWPPNVSPNGANLAHAVRYDIEDVVPFFQESSVALETLLDDPDVSYLTADDNWVHTAQLIALRARLDTGLTTATVTFSYELGIDGEFDDQNPVTIGTATIQPGDASTVILAAPIVTDVHVLRVIATYSSPTQAFPAFERKVGVAVYPE